MAVTALRLEVATWSPRAWSATALALAGLGVSAATWVIVGGDGDPSQVRWPLVVAPLAVCLVPVLAPRTGVRLGTAVALGGWCLLTGFSIGFLLLPALGAALGAFMREER